MRNIAALACLSGLIASHASAASLTPDMQKEIGIQVALADSLARSTDGRPDLAEFLDEARQDCAKAEQIASSADPDPYYQAEVSRCWGDVAGAAGDATACDDWMTARTKYLDPNAQGPTPTSVKTRLRWVTEDLTKRCGKSF
jgi:hypothetical protein